MLADGLGSLLAAAIFWYVQRPEIARLKADAVRLPATPRQIPAGKDLSPPVAGGRRA